MHIGAGFFLQSHLLPPENNVHQHLSAIIATLKSLTISSAHKKIIN